ncbi:MAG: helix-turn-helix domain-containing protein [Clostridiales bacterium]|nr:MAG: helix-turn-helix domain-containing protein [Clostridiales bacterium]
MKYNRYPKRDAVKNYFPLPNEIFSLGLSGGEILVYTYLMYREDRETFQCHPSYKTIGEAVGMSNNTVKKYVDGLVDKRLITTEPTSVITKKGEKRNGNLLYTIRPIQEAVDYFNAQQLRKADQEMARLNVIRKLEEYDRKHGIIDGKRSSLFEAG